MADDALLGRASRRAGERYPHVFVAGALAAYGRAHGLDEAAVAALLGVPPDRLWRLGLCRLPRNPAELARVAAHAGADPLALATVLGDPANDRA